MADTAASSTPIATPAPRMSDSPKLKQKWTSRMGTVVRRASKRFSIPKMHSQDNSAEKPEKAKGGKSGSVDLKRTSTSSASTSKSSLETGHVKSESAPAATAVPSTQPEVVAAVVSPPTSEPLSTLAPTLHDSTILDKSLVIVPLASTSEGPLSSSTSEQVPDTHTHILLPSALHQDALTSEPESIPPAVASEADDSLSVKSVPRPSATPEPVLVQIDLDESMVEVVIPLEEEEDDAAAAPLPLNAAAAAEEHVEESEGADQGVRFAEEVYIIESRTLVDDEEVVEVAKDTVDVVVVPVADVVEVEVDLTSDEDQQLLDSTIVPREEDTISLLEPTTQPEVVVETITPTDASPSTKVPTATATVVTPIDREEPSSSSSDKSPNSHMTAIVFALVSGAIVGVGALAYAGVIAGLSVGGIVAGLGGSIVTGWKGRRRTTRA